MWKIGVAAKPLMNCKEMFITYEEFEELISVFNSKQDKNPPEVNFDQFLQILAVLTNGTYEHRINAFIDMHDIQRMGPFWAGR